MQVKQRVSALRGGQSANLTAGTVNHQSAFAAARSDRTENRRQTCGNLANPEKTPGHPDNCTIPYDIDASPQRRGINREPAAPASRRMKGAQSRRSPPSLYTSNRNPDFRSAKSCAMPVFGSIATKSKPYHSTP